MPSAADKKKLFTFEYGSVQNGARGYYLIEIKALLVEWSGNLLFDEFQSILHHSLLEITTYKISNILMDVRRLNIRNHEGNDYVEKIWRPQAIMLGLRRGAVILPHNPMIALILSDLEQSIKNLPAYQAQVYQNYYTTELEQAIEWIRKNTHEKAVS
jgi:hypothetical protein